MKEDKLGRFIKGQIIWNKGLAKENNKRIKKSYNKKGIYIKCEECNKSFYIYKCMNGKRKFCSKKCSGIFKSQTKKGIYPISFKQYYKTHKPYNSGKRLSSYTKNTISDKVRQLWQSPEYREHMEKIHRKSISRRGNYLQIYFPQHPRANERGYVYQHIIIMEKIIGRYLRKKEIVHHIDGNRYNNQPANLKLFNNIKEHISFHRRNKIKSFAELT